MKFFGLFPTQEYWMIPIQILIFISIRLNTLIKHIPDRIGAVLYHKRAIPLPYSEYIIRRSRYIKFFVIHTIN